VKAYRVELLVIDHDHIGESAITQEVENARYGNDCISPQVMNIEGRDIGEWDDGHALNSRSKAVGEFQRLFALHAEGAAGPMGDAEVTGLSDFIRNASPEHKAEVYGKVMDKAAEQQQAVIDGVNASDCSRAAGHHFENGECVYCLDADTTYGVALPGPSLSMHPADKREMDRAFNEATDHSAQTLDMVAPGAGVPTLEPSAGAGSEPNSGTLVPAAGVKEVPRG
jgi:hypothetical protein